MTICLLLAGGCAFTTKPVASDLRDVAQALSSAALAEFPEDPLHRVVIVPVQGTEDTYVAIRDWIDSWSGDFVCFHYRNGRIEGTATVPEAPTEQSILAVRGFRLNGLPNPVVEVFGITHMGNGCYYLYELAGRELRLLLVTRGVDRHADLNLIRGEHLSPRYVDLNGDGFIDVELTGTVEEYDDDPHIEAPLCSYPCRKVFHWNPTSRLFVEDLSQREGFQSYGEEGN
jgi:hypothetical protein